MQVSRWRNGVLLACLLLVVEVTTATSARAQSDRPPIFDYALGAAKSDAAALKERQSDDLAALNQRALAIRDKAMAPDHPEAGASLNKLAELYRAQGRYAEAEPMYQRALAISEKALGPDHPDVGTLLNNLAELYRGQSRYAEAE